MFLPRIDIDLGLGASLSGVISGGSFLGYCCAIVFSAWATERYGARGVAVAAAMVAAIGMAGIAWAPAPQWLAAAVLLAGTSTGLASPPLAAAVAAAVPPARQDATNTAINAGTSAGVALSGPVALVLAGQWRLAFGTFAVIAVLLAAAVAHVLPKTSFLPETRRDNPPDGPPPLGGPMRRLIGAAFLMGAASTALWSFGGQLVKLRLGWNSTGTGLLWISIGAGGIAGAWAGALVARFGMHRVHRVFLAFMSAGILAVGSGLAIPVLALLGGALFGAAYMMLTGVYLVWGVKALSERPATGLTIGFLSIAVGQTVGAALFGLLLDRFGTGPATTAFAAAALLPGFILSGRPAAPAGGE